MSGPSYRIDETSVEVGTEWKYLYRAVDSVGCTIEFMLSARRDVSAAKRFFKKLMRADHRRLPFTKGVSALSDYVYEDDGRVKTAYDRTDARFDRSYLYDHVGRLVDARTSSAAYY